jgi:hypothetical protein
MNDETNTNPALLQSQLHLQKLGWIKPDNEEWTAKFAEKHPDEVNEVVDNLLQVIDEAGGSINTDYLLNRSLIDVLVNVCATNGIRFYYNQTHYLMSKAKCIEKR